VKDSFTERHFDGFILPAFLGLLTSLAAWLLWGFKFGIFNNEFHSIIVNRIADGIDFPGDAMAATMGNFPSPFWRLVAHCARYAPEEAVFLAFYVSAWALLYAGVSSLIAALAEEEHRFVPWLVGAAVTLSGGFLMNLPLGADPVMMPYLSQTFVSTGLCLLSLSLAIGKRHMGSAAVLGIACNVNAMQVNFMLPVLLASWVIDARLDGRNGLLRRVGNLLVFGLLASPALFRIASVVLEKPPGGSLSGWALYDFVKFYFPFHFFLDFKNTSQIVNGVALPLIPLLLAFSGRFLGDHRFRIRGEKIMEAASALFFGYLLAGILFSFHFPSRLILGMHFFRSDAVLFPAAVAMLSAALMNETRHDRNLVPMLGAALAAVLFQYFAASLALLVAIAAVKFLKERHPALCGPSGYPALYRALCGAFLLLLAPLAVAESVAFKKEHDGNWKGLNDATAEMERISRAASKAVPRDALFAIPPACYLRTHLRRGVYVSMHDGAAFFWKKGYEIEYLRRLRVCGIGYTPGVFRDAGRVTDEYLKNLPASLSRLKREGVTHALLPSFTIGRPPGGPVIRTENYVILGIDDAIRTIDPDPR